MCVCVSLWACLTRLRQTAFHTQRFHHAPHYVHAHTFASVQMVLLGGTCPPPPLQSGEAIEGVATLHTCSNIVLQDCWAQGLQTAAVCSLNRFFCWNTHLLRFNRSLLAHSLTHSLIHTHTHTHSLTLFTHSHTRSLTHTKRAHTGACYRFGSRFHLLNRPFNPDDGNC